MEITIFVDIDGVVADLIPVWLRRYNEDWKDNLSPEDITEYDIQLFVKRECGSGIYSYLEDWSIYEEVLPIPGSLKAIQKMQKFFRVVFVTTNPISVSEIKFSWLCRNGFLDWNSLKNYIKIKDRSLLKSENSILIDDSLENCKAFGGTGLIFNQPWNQGYDPRITNWDSILTLSDEDLKYVFGEESKRKALIQKSYKMPSFFRKGDSTMEYKR